MSETRSRDGEAPAVSIVVPVKNEAGNIEPLVAEIAAALGGAGGFEIVYVDDGSSDATARAIARPDGGAGRGCGRSGMRYRADNRPRCAPACAMRAPRSWSRSTATARTIRPSFRRWCGALEAGAPRIGLIAGQRVGRRASGFKKLQSRIANAVRGAILRDGTRDSGCGLKAFRREVFLALPYFDGLHRFLPALVRREGYDIGYVDVVDRLRRQGVSNYGMWDRLWIGILDLAGVWWLIRRKRRVPDAAEVKRNAD